MSEKNVIGTTTLPPWGTTAWLPDDCARLRSSEEKLRGVFRDSGGREIATPSFENAEVLAENFGSAGLIRFLDEEGTALALRPELTTSAARLYASALQGEPTPCRLFYTGQVFRAQKRHHGRLREFRQAGFEIYGGNRGQTDSEILILALRALRELSDEPPVVQISHAAIVPEIIESLDEEESVQNELMAAVGRKDRDALRKLPRGEGFLALIDASNREEAAAAISVLGNDTAALKGAEEIEELLGNCSELSSEDVFVEYAYLPSVPYYTGIVFEIFLAGIGHGVVSGGRYDDLVARFGGKPTPATGFSLELEHLLARSPRR